MKRATFGTSYLPHFFGNFNPRPREEGDKRSRPYRYGKNISIHALVKRATPALIDLLDEVGISIHALVKRATVGGRDPARQRAISIHALVKRATAHWVFEGRSDPHFNPRPREEGDSVRVIPLLGDQISIHALVKRATESANRESGEISISIHALVKRATMVTQGQRV